VRPRYLHVADERVEESSQRAALPLHHLRHLYCTSAFPLRALRPAILTPETPLTGVQETPSAPPRRRVSGSGWSRVERRARAPGGPRTRACVVPPKAIVMDMT
jgi:hypothetical protein